MKIHRFVLSLVTPLALSLGFAGQASASGACVFVQHEALQCTQASSLSACTSRSSDGEFHSGTTCRNIGYGKTWGLAKPPAPPAKADFDGMSAAPERDLPAIESPVEKPMRKKQNRG